MRGFDPDPRRHMAINSARLAALRDGSGGKPLDVMFRPARDGFTARLLALTRTDLGTFNKGTLAGWGIDSRDPTVDRRVIEFCLQIPPRAWFRDGEPRALARLAWADRLPGPVISEKRRGLQAADWGARIGLAGDRLAAEIESIAACDAARQVLDVERMRALARNWPDQDWHRPELVVEYRLLLLRAISAGHFLRRAAGANG
jgi:asparagine synthase (glutamine-hydrolysing)